MVDQVPTRSNPERDRKNIVDVIQASMLIVLTPQSSDHQRRIELVMK
jgi:hypothetical protein